MRYNRPMNRLGAILVLSALVLIAGCTFERYARLYDSARVEPDDRRGYRVAEGEGIVLELHKVRGIPVPDAFWGHSLFLQTDSTHLIESTVLHVPSTEAVAFLSQLQAPKYVPSTEISGEVTILVVDDSFVKVKLKVSCPELGWKYHGTARFHRRPLEYFGNTDRHMKRVGRAV